MKLHLKNAQITILCVGSYLMGHYLRVIKFSILWPNFCKRLGDFGQYLERKLRSRPDLRGILMS